MTPFMTRTDANGIRLKANVCSINSEVMLMLSRPSKRAQGVSVENQPSKAGHKTCTRKEAGRLKHKDMRENLLNDVHVQFPSSHCQCRFGHPLSGNRSVNACRVVDNSGS